MDAWRVVVSQGIYNDEHELCDASFTQYVATLAMASAIVKRMQPEPDYRVIHNIQIEYIWIHVEGGLANGNDSPE